MSEKKSRSRRLKRYQIEYDKFIKNINNCNVKNNTVKKDVKDNKSKRKLNSYQKFVKKEIKKMKYKDLSSKERMIQIAKLWKEKINN